MPATTPQSDNRNLPAVRLAVPEAALREVGLDMSAWKVLTETIFPSAKTPEGVLMAVRYCQARGLDIMRRPVHVVPMWSAKLQRNVETVWPGISEVQTTAARTGQWAGMEPPVFGPEKTKTFKGRVKVNDQWTDAEATVTYSEWCQVTVYRVVKDTRCPFTETVFWEETYSRAGGAKSELPTDMWIKRPKGQLVKCAKAASLRAAFPEEADYTAEEMEGKTLESGNGPIREAVVIDVEASRSEKQSEAVDTQTQPPVSEEEMAKGAVIDNEVEELVAKLVTRTVRAGAWTAADEYARAHFTGEHLKYAKRELALAKSQAEKAKVAA